MIIYVDIDETICFYSGTRRYDLSEPNYDNIAKINKLYEDGWKIVYWTSRGAVSGKDYTEYTKKARQNNGGLSQISEKLIRCMPLLLQDLPSAPRRRK